MIPARSLAHLTLETGDSRLSPRAEVAQAVIEGLRPLVLGSHGEIPSKPGFILRTTRTGTAAMFTVERDATPRAPWPHGRCPIVTCGLAQTEEDARHVWDLLVKMHRNLYPARGRSTRRTPEEWRRQPLTRPDTLPWLAVVAQPGLGLLRPADLDWLGDFERCVAWTLIDLPPEPNP